MPNGSGGRWLCPALCPDLVSTAVARFFLRALAMISIITLEASRENVRRDGTDVAFARWLAILFFFQRSILERKLDELLDVSVPRDGNSSSSGGSMSDVVK